VSSSYICGAIQGVSTVAKRIAVPLNRPSVVVGALVVALLLATAAATSAQAGSSSSRLPHTKLKFAGPNARLVGSRAVVLVFCFAPRSQSCAGTASLRVAGADHEIAFSIRGGRRQHLAIPLGADRRRVNGRRIRALAETVQPLGSPQRTRRLLRVR
jgi:hypothetical protein